MEPTLAGVDIYNPDKIADRVMVYKSSYLLGESPQYNEVVIIDSHIDQKRTIKDNFLQNPLVSLVMKDQNADSKRYWIKRIIGVAGDTLEYKNGKVYRNGEELKEGYIKEDMVWPFETVVVPEGHVFVMGDNRNFSCDSREIGPVPTENVVGKVFIRFYPFEKVSKF